MHGPLTRHGTLRVAHAPGMPGTFSPPPHVSDPDMHHGTCATQVPWCMPGSLTDGFLWIRWRGKHSRRMRNPQFSVSGKRHMEWMGWMLPWKVLCILEYIGNNTSLLAALLLMLLWSNAENGRLKFAQDDHSGILHKLGFQDLCHHLSWFK